MGPKRNWWTVGFFALLVILAVMLLCWTGLWNNWLPDWAHCRWCEPASVTSQAYESDIGGVLPDDIASPAPSAKTDDAAKKDCLPVKDAWALAERQTLEHLHEFLRKKGIKGKAAEEIEAYVKDHPYGTGKTGPDKELSFTGVSVVAWNYTFPDKVHFEWSDERKLCICHVWGRLVVTMPPPPKRPAPPPRAYVPPAENGCYDISFNASEDAPIHWGIGSVDGKMLPSACNAQREGYHGRFTAWWGECSTCTASIGILEQILHGVVTVWHKFFYRATETHQTLRFGPDIRTKVVYICITLPDGTTHGVVVRPQDWRGTHHVVIQDRMWHGPIGMEQNSR